MTDAARIARINQAITLWGRPTAEDSKWLLAQLQAAQDKATRVQAQNEQYQVEVDKWWGFRNEQLLEYQVAQERIAALEQVLLDLVDASTCRLADNDGFCLVHGHDKPCPHQRGQELLSKEALLK